VTDAGHRVQVHSAARAAIMVVALIAAGFAALIGGASVARPAVALSSDDPRIDGHLVEFRELERNPTDAYRWSWRRGAIVIDGSGGQPLWLRLRLTSPRPADAPPADLNLERGARSVAQFRLADGWRTYHMLLPPDAQGSERIRLRIATFAPEPDEPGLGVALSALAFGVVADPWWPWRMLDVLGPMRALLLGSTPMLLALIAMRGLGRAAPRLRTTIAVLASGIGAAVAWVAAMYPFETNHVLPAAWFAPGVVVGVLLLGLIIARVVAPHRWHPHEARLITWLSRDRHALIAALVVALLQGGLYVAMVPFGRHYDEPAHLEYAWMVTFNDRVTRATPRHPDLAALAGPRQIIGNPTTYYRIVGATFRFVDQHDYTRQLYLGRMVSLGMFLITIAAGFATMREITAPGSSLRWAVPLTMALLPTFADLMTALSSDVGAITGYSLTLWAAARLVCRGITFPRLAACIGAALLAASMKNTAVTAPIVVLIACTLALQLRWRWRWRWILLAVATPLICIAVLVVRWDDPVLWYRSSGVNPAASLRAAAPGTPLGHYALQVQGSANGSPAALHPVPRGMLPGLAGETITVGAWLWADRPTTATVPRLQYDRRDFVTRFAQPAEPTVIGRQPRFVAWQFVVPMFTGSLFYQVDGIVNADDPANTLYLDGAVIAVGAFPVDQPPQFSDESGRSGTWGGQPFTNLIRSASFEQGGGPWMDHRVEEVFNTFAHLAPSMLMTAATDWDFFYVPMIRDGLPWMIFTLFGAYGWSDVLLEGLWWKWIFWCITAVSILGSIYYIGNRRINDHQRSIILLLTIPAVIVWIGSLSRLFITVMTSPLPFARYAFPVMTITIFVLVVGLSAFFRGYAQHYVRFMVVVATIALNILALLTMWNSYYMLPA
jgi:hypothetical protein